MEHIYIHITDEGLIGAFAFIAIGIGAFAYFKYNDW